MAQTRRMGIQMKEAQLPVLFRWGTELILTDTGIGSIVGDPIGRLDQRLSALGVKPQEISAVLLTHLHIDHVGGSLDRANKKSLSPRARILSPRWRLNSGEHQAPTLAS